MRPSGSPLGTWHTSLEHWLSSRGYLDSAGVRNYANEMIGKIPGGGALTPFPADGTLEAALAVQRRLIAARGDDKVLGYKAAATSAAAQADLGLKGPLAGPLGKVTFEVND